ncbi:ABC transporter permease [Candidatus Micrarchaeota archaeon]|nr:ABC transporter permease [Candidatus Micrarchaeota archaeon]
MKHQKLGHLGLEEGEKLIDFEKIKAIILKNWFVLRSDKARLGPMLMFPVVMILIFGYSSGVAPKNLPAALVDYDNSVLSNQVVAQLQSLSVLSIKHHLGTESEGKRLMDEGQIQALIVIPPGFGKTVQVGKPATIRLLVDESEPTVAQIVRSSIQVFVQRMSSQISLQRLSEQQRRAIVARQQLASAQAILLYGDGTGADAYRLSLQSLASAQSSIRANMLAVQKSAQTVAGGLSTPSNQDLLRSPEFSQNTALQDSSSRAAQVKSIAQQQALLGQMAAYNALAGLDANALKQAVLAQIQLAKWNGANQAQAALNAQASSSVASADAVLEQVATQDISVLSEPIHLEQVPAYGQNRQGIDFLLPNLLALIIFQGAVQGMGRAIAGERKDGSLTRVFLTPTSNVTILVGTQLFYIIFEAFRSSFIVFLAILLFGVKISGSIVEILFIIALFAAGSVGVGMLLSAMAKGEEQYQPLAIMVSLPMLFLAGVFLPIQTMPAPLQAVANVIPIHYAGDALRGVMIKGFSIVTVWPDILYLMAFAAVTFVASLVVFKREVL